MFVLCIFKIALSSLLHLARMYKQQFYNKVLFTWVSVRLKLLLPLLIYSDRIIARQFWSSLILILLSPCQNWLLLLFYFSDLPVRTVVVPLLAKFLAKLQARFWAKLSGKFPVNCNETYVHENATFNFLHLLQNSHWLSLFSIFTCRCIFRAMKDWARYFPFLRSRWIYNMRSESFYLFCPDELYLHKVCPSIKHYSVFIAIFMSWEMTNLILKNTDYRSSHLKG